MNTLPELADRYREILADWQALAEEEMDALAAASIDLTMALWAAQIVRARIGRHPKA